jgi:hypothetical protein
MNPGNFTDHGRAVFVSSVLKVQAQPPITGVPFWRVCLGRRLNIWSFKHGDVPAISLPGSKGNRAQGPAAFNAPK